MLLVVFRPATFYVESSRARQDDDCSENAKTHTIWTNTNTKKKNPRPCMICVCLLILSCSEAVTSFSSHVYAVCVRVLFLDVCVSINFQSVR